MAARDRTTGATGTDVPGTGAGATGSRLGRGARRLSTETKSFFKTSEWWTYVVILVALLIAGNSIEGEEGGADFFAADKVWLYVTILTVGYLISRGIAKAGSRDPYWDERGDRNADH
jgi:hypothetical protein